MGGELYNKLVNFTKEKGFEVGNLIKVIHVWEKW